jgi:hypothetical protein
LRPIEGEFAFFGRSVSSVLTLSGQSFFTNRRDPIGQNHQSLSSSGTLADFEEPEKVPFTSFHHSPLGLFFLIRRKIYESALATV